MVKLRERIEVIKGSINQKSIQEKMNQYEYSKTYKLFFLGGQRENKIHQRIRANHSGRKQRKIHDKLLVVTVHESGIGEPIHYKYNNPKRDVPQKAVPEKYG